MPRIDFTAEEVFEVENALLREAYHKERLAHAESTARLSKEVLVHIQKDKDLLFLRLAMKYVEGKAGAKLTPDGRGLEYGESTSISEQPGEPPK